MSPAPVGRKKVAIVGSGCAGLGATWALKDTDYEVHVFERSSKLGGHTNTQPFQDRRGRELAVDTGFIVMNTATYPNFIRFLQHVGIHPVETAMTFGVSRDHGAFEWSGEPRGIFAQRRNLLRPRHWRMIYDIVRFNQFALDVLADDSDGPLKTPGFNQKQRRHAADMTIGQYLDQAGYSDAFRDDYLIPMTAAVWSTSPDKASLSFPAKTLIRFMWNHHLLSTLADRPPWLTISGGSQRYIDAIIDQYPADRLRVHTSCEVASVLRPTDEDAGLVTVSWNDVVSGRIEVDAFDHVILACHGDEVLPLLTKHGSSRMASSSFTPQRSSTSANSNTSSSLSFTNSSSAVQEEIDIFSAFQTTKNVCYLHSDLALMPQRRAVWTSWNYLIESKPSKLAHPAGVSLTYCMNILQHLPEEEHGPVLVTMNPGQPPQSELTQGKFIYTHPLYTVESVRAQERLQHLQNRRGVSYCGAWTKYGFHEDGFSSGLRVASEHLGAKLPFAFVDSTFSRGHRPSLCWKDYLLRLILLYLLLWIRVVEWILQLPIVAPVVGVLDALSARALNSLEYLNIL